MEGIRAENINKSFGNTQVFQEMSVTMEGGQIHGLVGKNGAGKTTFIRMLSGLVSPDLGDLFVCGLFLSRKNLPAIKRQISVLGDLNRALYWNITGRDNLNYLSAIKSGREDPVQREHIRKLIAYFRMESYIDRKVETYSKGMKQKLLLLSAFLSKPTLLIMDEPMNGLDFQNSLLLKSALRSFVTETGGTVLITSHDQQLLDEICESQFIINEKKIIPYEHAATRKSMSFYLDCVRDTDLPAFFAATCGTFYKQSRFAPLSGNIWKMDVLFDEALDFGFLARGIRERVFRLVDIETHV